ncbi:TPD1 protein homolog 1 [Selaginella moellendorffii]|uniref:TPD1 protein homolog 1 n=1 Tax=Selaginella moellendorffii TaxID=88036 RepID=UPI000D1D0E2C|nr:TPD1 protein homolog 1 [Selaginella moellendorffii]|eukprot:XP_024518811.1 TPD1 protein homolog 1 [Selaginella moellendorffii]
MTATILLTCALLLIGCRYFGGNASRSVGKDPAFALSGEAIHHRLETGSYGSSDASSGEGDGIRASESHKLAATSRKLLAGNSCTSKDISISQGRDSSSSGIPQYVVQIVNTCMSDCAPSNIHVFCGWFASAPLVNPKAFRRLNYDDCLVNDGKPLRHGEIIRFQYANSFMYPLRFKSAKFC